MICLVCPNKSLKLYLPLKKGYIINSPMARSVKEPTAYHRIWTTWCKTWLLVMLKYLGYSIPSTSLTSQRPQKRSSPELLRDTQINNDRWSQMQGIFRIAYHVFPIHRILSSLFSPWRENRIEHTLLPIEVKYSIEYSRE